MEHKSMIQVLWAIFLIPSRAAGTLDGFITVVSNLAFIYTSHEHNKNTIAQTMNNVSRQNIMVSITEGK